MDVFELRKTVVDEYSAYIKSFLRIKDAEIKRFVDDELESGRLWPDPLVQLNPSFEPGETIDDLVARGVLAPECQRIFRRDKDQAGFGLSLRLHRHQQDAIEVAGPGGSYVLTTGPAHVHHERRNAVLVPILSRAGRVDHTRMASAPTRSPTRLLMRRKLWGIDQHWTCPHDC